MKRFIPLCCAALLLFSLCSCKNTPKSTISSAAPTNMAPTVTQSTTAAPVKNVAGAAIANLSNKKIVWGPGKTKDKIRPTDPVSLQKEYEKYGAWFIAPDTPKIYLTFDEGYENGYTPKILDVLKEKKVSAVFFVTYDFAKSNPELIRRMIDEGHVVGNHTYRHKIMDEIPLETAAEEINVLHDYIKKNFNYTMKLFRPPQGEFSERTLALTQSLGYRSVFWSFAYADWDPKKQPAAETAMEKICSSAHNGAIYLLHAVSKTNTEVLGSVIDRLTQQGYEFCKFEL